jgi:hypothetical protein
MTKPKRPIAIVTPMSARRRPRSARIAEELNQEELLAGVAERARAPGQRKHRHEVKEDERRERRQDPEHERLPVVSEDGEHRNLDPCAAIDRVLEDGRLADRQPDVEAHEDQDRAREERNPPAEGKELFVAQPAREHEKHGAGEEEADGRPQLREHAVPGAAARRRVLDRQQDGTAPLATEAQALAKAADREQERRGHSNGLVGGQRANRHGRDPHGQERRDERRLAAHAIPEVAEERRPDRAREEGDGERRERGEGGRRGVGRRKEELRKDDEKSKNSIVVPTRLAKRTWRAVLMGLDAPWTLP